MLAKRLNSDTFAQAAGVVGIVIIIMVVNAHSGRLMADSAVAAGGLAALVATLLPRWGYSIRSGSLKDRIVALAWYLIAVFVGGVLAILFGFN